MSTDLENYYMKHPEPVQGCLLALKHIILSIDNQITHERKYQIPFFCYKGKRLGFLWVHRKKPMVGFVTDCRIYPATPGIKRKDSIETLIFDPNADIPAEIIREKIIKLMEIYDRLT